MNSNKFLSRLFVVLTLLAQPSPGRGDSKDSADILSLFPESEVEAMLLSARASSNLHGESGGPEALTLLQFSDIHGSKVNLERILRFSRRYDSYIDDLIHTGDAVYCYWDDENIFKTVPGADKILNTVGNHDCWKSHKVWAESDKPYDATEKEVYEMLFDGPVSKWGVTESSHPFGCYYYKDYPDSKTRLITLDCMHFTEGQDAWLRETLDEALAKGLAVIGVTHYPSSTGLSPVECGFTPPGMELPRESDTTRVQYESMSEAAFKSVDRFIDKGGNFVCWLSGHTHSDYIGLVKDHERQLQVIADKAGEMDGYIKEDRTRGTVNQDAFNLVTFNPARSLLVIYRIGCRRGPDMRSKKLFVYDCTKRKVITSE